VTGRRDKFMGLRIVWKNPDRCGGSMEAPSTQQVAVKENLDSKIAGAEEPQGPNHEALLHGDPPSGAESD